MFLAIFSCTGNPIFSIVFLLFSCFSVCMRSTVCVTRELIADATSSVCRKQGPEYRMVEPQPTQVSKRPQNAKRHPTLLEYYCGISNDKSFVPSKHRPPLPGHDMIEEAP